mgnify:CR=1 FL=1
MRIKIISLLFILLLVGCEKKKSIRLFLTQYEPYRFEEITSDMYYYQFGYSGEDSVEHRNRLIEENKASELPDRAFQKWEYLTFYVDGKKGYTPRTEDRIEVGSTTDIPKQIEISAPIEKPIYFALGVEHHDSCGGRYYQFIKKGLITPEAPAITLQIDKTKIK